MDNIITIILIIFVFVSAAYEIIKIWPNSGAMGINLDRVKCPKCNTPLPIIRKPKNQTQVLFGGWTCHCCGCEVDKYGNERNT
jgi:hypothetical protein